MRSAREMAGLAGVVRVVPFDDVSRAFHGSFSSLESHVVHCDGEGCQIAAISRVTEVLSALVASDGTSCLMHLSLATCGISCVRHPAIRPHAPSSAIQAPHATRPRVDLTPVPCRGRPAGTQRRGATCWACGVNAGVSRRMRRRRCDDDRFVTGKSQGLQAR